LFKFCQKPIILSVFWVAVLIFGGILFLANRAYASCICRDSSWDYSAVTTESNCEAMCSNHDGVASFATPAPQECPLGQALNPDTGSCEQSVILPPASDDFGTQGCPANPCPGGYSCNTDTGTCEISPYEPGTGDFGKTLPGKGDFGKTVPSGGGLSNVSLPNFIGVTSISELILKIVRFLMALAIPFAIFMLVWAGFLFATAQGSEEKINKAKRNLIWTVVGIAVILASEVIVDYISEILGAGGAGRGSALMNRIKTVLNEITVLLFVLVTVYFGWGVVKYVRAAGDEKAIAEGKKHMLWGIIGMAVMAGAWGIVRIIQEFVK
jgi:hypothetical protein